jgi:DNA-binding XRE family transcriptional regulator
MNANKLKGRMVEAGYSQRTLAAAAKMSENSLGNKINGKSSFTLDEATKICSILSITDPLEKAAIFLSEASQ